MTACRGVLRDTERGMVMFAGRQGGHGQTGQGAGEDRVRDRGSKGETEEAFASVLLSAESVGACRVPGPVWVCGGQEAGSCTRGEVSWVREWAWHIASTGCQAQCGLWDTARHSRQEERWHRARGRETTVSEERTSRWDEEGEGSTRPSTGTEAGSTWISSSSWLGPPGVSLTLSTLPRLVAT